MSVSYTHLDVYKRQVMGMAQDVYLAEFDGVQQRTFFIEIIGE